MFFLALIDHYVACDPCQFLCVCEIKMLHLVFMSAVTTVVDGQQTL